MIRWIVLALVLLLLGAGCATNGKRVQNLLAKDFSSMSDADLELYYLQLNDEIAYQMRRQRRSAVGVGVGTGVGTAGVAVGVSKEIPQKGPVPQLMDRRNEVRMELQKRGLRP